MDNPEIDQKLIPFQPENLAEVLDFLGECSRLSNFANPHSGDIAHWMSNGYRGRDLANHFWLYRDVNNNIVAFGELSRPENPAFEVILHPEYRGSQLELTLLKACETQIVERVQTNNIENKPLVTTAFSGDSTRIKFLEELGYQKDPNYLDLFTARSLQEPIPAPALPQGYFIRNVAGEHEIKAIIEVHNSSFNSSWTESKYLEVMHTPGFAMEREMVVVTPDNSFAAFIIYWLDPVSSSGLFEPVGCHKDFRQKGLTKALMYAVMHRMKAAGIETALVRYHAKNEAGRALYSSVGFHSALHEVYEYSSTKLSP